MTDLKHKLDDADERIDELEDDLYAVEKENRTLKERIKQLESQRP